MTSLSSALRPSAVLATLLVASSFPALASTVTFDPNNQISFAGADSYNSTTVTFLNAGNLTIGATGIFAPFNGASTTFNGFNYTTTPFTSFTLFNSKATGGDTLSFDVTSLLNSSTGSNLDVYGYGSYLLNGKSVQEGVFELTTQGAQNSTVTFSDTNSIAAAPEPASLALLGTGLVGLVGVVRRRLA